MTGMGRSTLRLGMALVAFLGCSLSSGCGAFTGPGDLVVANPAEAVQDARRMIAEQQADPEKHKGWLTDAQLPASLRVRGLRFASVHGDHLDLVLARNPDFKIGGRIWATVHRKHQDLPTKYAEIFFYDYNNDLPETPTNIE